MPGQLAPAATVQQEIRTYEQRKEAAKEKIHQKLGEEVIIHQQNEQVAWKVIAESHAPLTKKTQQTQNPSEFINLLSQNFSSALVFLLVLQNMV